MSLLRCGVSNFAFTFSFQALRKSRRKQILFSFHGRTKKKKEKVRQLWVAPSLFLLVILFNGWSQDQSVYFFFQGCQKRKPTVIITLWRLLVILIASGTSITSVVFSL